MSWFGDQTWQTLAAGQTVEGSIWGSGFGFLRVVPELGFWGTGSWWHP